jgi:hypothetical protein
MERVTLPCPGPAFLLEDATLLTPTCDDRKRSALMVGQLLDILPRLEHMFDTVIAAPEPISRVCRCRQ